MKFSKELILAFKITILLLLFGFIVIYSIPYINHSGFLNLRQGNSRNFIFISLIFLTYIISYFIAKLTIKPIEENNKKLKEYNHNLAHELKTPLAVLKSNIELLEIGEDKELLSSSKEEIFQMEKVIDSLLFLAENKELKDKSKINIKELLPKYLSDDIKLKIDSDFIFLGNENLIDSLLKNLIENARKYGKKGKKININISKTHLTISNTVKGNLDLKDLNKLFDTFYQLDSSRNSSGYGLGLSIIKKICDLHGFKIKLGVNNGIFKVVIGIR